jgi:hypothetical protein
VARREAYRLGLIKDVENRTWQTKMRGRFAIQASLSIKRAAYDELANEIGEHRGIIVPSFHEIREMTGGIIGTANLIDCVREYMDSTWKRGRISRQHHNTNTTRTPLPIRPTSNNKNTKHQTTPHPQDR